MPSPVPPVQQLGSAVLLQGRAVIDVHYLVAIGVRETTRRDGISPSPRLQALLKVLASAARDLQAESAVGPADVRIEADAEPSTVLDDTTTAEAATMLGISSRQVRRLAHELGGHQVRGAWIFPRGAIESAHRNRCSQKESAR